MTRLLVHHLVLSLLLLPLVGCDAFPDIFGGDQTRVRLVNDGDFDIEVEIFIDDNQNVSKSNLTDNGTRLSFTIEEGKSITFSRDCDDLQAIIIDDADLDILGGSGPEVSTDVLRDGADFGCRDTITFTFDHSFLLLDFDVDIDVDSP